MRRIAILDAPSNLGLRPPTETSVPGCAKAPGALRDHDLVARLAARDAGCLTPPRYDPGDWRPGDGVCHAEQIAAYSVALADRIGSIIDAGEFPVVLGGDCSILLGSALAMHRLGEVVGGRIGLVFVDGHSDFRHPGNASYVGAAAGEDLALATGRGQADLAGIEGRRPYFRDVDVVVLGIRAQDEYRLDLQAAGIITRPVPALRVEGAARTAQWARDQLSDCAGYWVHVDVDVLDPAVMPAVDAPDPGGIAFAELELLLSGLVDTPHCLGVEITVFDPDYDPDGSYAAEIVETVVAGLAPVRMADAPPAAAVSTVTAVDSEAVDLPAADGGSLPSVAADPSRSGGSVSSEAAGFGSSGPGPSDASSPGEAAAGSVVSLPEEAADKPAAAVGSVVSPPEEAGGLRPDEAVSPPEEADPAGERPAGGSSPVWADPSPGTDGPQGTPQSGVPVTAPSDVQSGEAAPATPVEEPSVAPEAKPMPVAPSARKPSTHDSDPAAMASTGRMASGSAAAPSGVSTFPPLLADSAAAEVLAAAAAAAGIRKPPTARKPSDDEPPKRDLPRADAKLGPAVDEDSEGGAHDDPKQRAGVRAEPKAAPKPAAYATPDGGVREEPEAAPQPAVRTTEAGTRDEPKAEPGAQHKPESEPSPGGRTMPERDPSSGRFKAASDSSSSRKGGADPSRQAKREQADPDSRTRGRAESDSTLRRKAESAWMDVAADLAARRGTPAERAARRGSDVGPLGLPNDDDLGSAKLRRADDDPGPGKLRRVDEDLGPARSRRSDDTDGPPQQRRGDDDLGPGKLRRADVDVGPGRLRRSDVDVGPGRLRRSDDDVGPGGLRRGGDDVGPGGLRRGEDIAGPGGLRRGDDPLGPAGLRRGGPAESSWKEDQPEPPADTGGQAEPSARDDDETAESRPPARGGMSVPSFESFGSAAKSGPGRLRRPKKGPSGEIA